MAEVTLSQAHAFFSALLSKPMVIHLEAVFGLGVVPKIEDFNSQSKEVVERVRRLLHYISNHVVTVAASLPTGFDIQKEVPVEPGPPGGPEVYDLVPTKKPILEPDETLRADPKLGEVPPVGPGQPTEPAATCASTEEVAAAPSTEDKDEEDAAVDAVETITDAEVNGTFRCMKCRKMKNRTKDGYVVKKNGDVVCRPCGRSHHK